MYSYGYELIYAEDAVVLHPARNSFRDLKKKIVRVTGGLYELREQNKGSFLSDFVSDLLPPVKRMAAVCLNEKIRGANQKLKIAFLLLLLKYVRVFERIRLRLGGKATRS